MKAAVLHVNTCKPDSDAPTMRIARFVSEQLGLPLIHDVPSATKHVRARFDVLFVMFGILKFSEHREQALEIYSRAKRVIRLENDYLFKPDSRFKKLQPYEVWSTVPHSVQESGGLYINWNQLTWDNTFEPHGWPRHAGLLYYGAYKEEQRAAQIKAYYGPQVPYPVTFSANPRNKAKFAALNPQARLVPKLTHSEIAAYAATVYLEDEYSHAMYCSMANRFYECLHLGVAMFFDLQTMRTLQDAGYYKDAFPAWVVRNHYAVERLLPRARSIAAAQRAVWHRNYYALLCRELAAAATTVGLCRVK